MERLGNLLPKAQRDLTQANHSDKWYEAYGITKPYYADDAVCIVHGDCREVLPSIPDKSIDLVLTDPPYPEQYLELYGTLSEQAKRVLKEGGFCYAYLGAMHLPRALPLFLSHLDWFFLYNIRHNGGWPSLWKVKIQANSKPVFCATNGAPTKLAWSTCDFTKEKQNKNHH